MEKPYVMQEEGKVSKNKIIIGRLERLLHRRNECQNVLNLKDFRWRTLLQCEAVASLYIFDYIFLVVWL